MLELLSGFLSWYTGLSVFWIVFLGLLLGPTALAIVGQVIYLLAMAVMVPLVAATSLIASLTKG